jgi:hypothetical protein
LKEKGRDSAIQFGKEAKRVVCRVAGSTTATHWLPSTEHWNIKNAELQTHKDGPSGNKTTPK